MTFNARKRQFEVQGATSGAPREQTFLVTSLSCDDAMVVAIVDHLRRALPAEGVGLLSAIRTGNMLVGRRFYAGRNIESSNVRYTMDPVEVRMALGEMKRHGETVGAVVHSHPRTPPVPSKTDLVEATMPGIVHLIVGFEPEISIRAWWMDFDAHGAAIVAREVEFQSGIASGTGERGYPAAGRGAFEQRGDHERDRRAIATNRWNDAEDSRAEQRYVDH